MPQNNRPMSPARNPRAGKISYTKRLGSHLHIPHYSGRVEVTADVYSLRLELAQWGNLRDLIVNTHQCAPPLDTRLKMALQTSSTLAYIHTKLVFHCDISCRNIFGFPDWYAKIGGFGGSKLNDKEPLDVAEEIRYELPRSGRRWDGRPFIKWELFALGSAIYEMIA